MTAPSRRCLAPALLLIALATLMAEVLLIRVFEVILLANIGYAVITCAMFAFGVAGTYATIWPVPANANIGRRLAILAILFAVSILLLRPAMNATPHLYELFSSVPILEYLTAGGLLYGLVLVPFFLSGLLLANLFSAYPSHIRSLYFWDLVGAALGCVLFLPFLRAIGPGGLMFGVAAAALVAAALFIGTRKVIISAVLVASALMITPFLRSDGYFEFRGHQDKRGLLNAQLGGRVEFSEWDSMAKIDVEDQGLQKHVAYDGGSQSSHLFAFDGDLAALRHRLDEGGAAYAGQFWHPSVLAAHYLRRDSGADVVIFGSAAGQEAKAALIYNPARVEGIELVGTVVNLGQGRYSDYIGGIFRDPRVHNQVGEARSWLRASGQNFDIVQIHSNHSTSFVSSGIGAAMAVYLQTVEAYREYIDHLKPDGILQINHHFYPRVVATAAQAWREQGRTDFRRHVLVYENTIGVDQLPTLLLKNSTWSDAEIAEMDQFFARHFDFEHAYVKVVDPRPDGISLLTPDFFTGETSAAWADIPYQVEPTTDDRPYFNNIQKGFSRLTEDSARMVNHSMAYAVNERLRWPAGEYTVPLAIGVIGAFFGVILIVGPLRFSRAGKLHWPQRSLALAYFALLGCGFIIIELVLVQIFMQLLGFPLYAYTSVLFATLFSAGVGSLSAQRLGIDPVKRWGIPFVGIVLTGGLLILTHQQLFAVFLGAPMLGRILAAFCMIFPVGFFLGMPFPLGILALEKQPPGAIAWAWGMNGLFTVLGGVMAGALSMYVGFQLTFAVALGIYALAFAAFSRIRLVAGVRVGENVTVSTAAAAIVGSDAMQPAIAAGS